MNNITAYKNRRKISACAGIIGPMLFVGVFTIEGWLRSGYHPLGMYVSALSLGTRGWIQITNFIVFGLLLLIFTLGVASEFQNGKASKAGPLLLLIIAIGFLFSGPFVMDPMGTLRDQMSVHGTLHGILGGIVFSLMPVSCFVFLRRFREDRKWHYLHKWTLSLGMIITVAVAVLTIATKLPAVQQAFIDWLGLIQRAAIVPYMIWLFSFALGLYQQND
jgi:hypothetical protein